MGTSRKHPEALCLLVGRAIADGMDAKDAWRRVNDGTLEGWSDPYPMPYETARYYGTREKQRRRSSRISPRVARDPAGAVDHLAKSLLSEADEAIGLLRERGKKDPETLKKWAEVLAKLNPLVRPEPTGNGKQAPRDPLARSLAAAMKSNPSPGDTPSGEGTTGEHHGEQRPDAASTHAHTQPSHAAHGAVASPGPNEPVQTPADGEGWGGVVPVGPAST